MEMTWPACHPLFRFMWYLARAMYKFQVGGWSGVPRIILRVKHFGPNFLLGVKVGTVYTLVLILHMTELSCDFAGQ